ncbi:hypothetical protein QOZ80_5BG0412880 [Eleusine coracana subsp. coracana]|nr:hypothetical protein QOZ80_5BG0412880 [Eleusine coracana subsp. coracana]
MDAADAMASPLGAWASIRGYFTPATLFVVLNVVIGTIALTSRSRDQRRRRREIHRHDYAHHLHDPQAAHYQAPPLHDPHQHQEYNPYYQQQQPDQYAPLARTSSVLDRLRSIGLYHFRSGDFPPEYGTTTTTSAAASHHDAFPPVDEEESTKQYARSRSDPVPARDAAPPRMKKSGTQVARKSKQQPARVPATRVVEAVAEDDEAAAVVVDARAEAFSGGLIRQREPASPQKAEYLPHHDDDEEEEYVPPSAPMRAPPPLSRTSSVLDRLRSLGLYNFLSADQPPAAAPTPDAFVAADAPAAAANKQAPAHYDRSRSEPPRQQAVKKEKKPQPAEAKMAKSSSSSTTTRKPAAAGRSLVSQQSVNTRAEAFIDSFRKGQSQPQNQQQLHHHDEDHDEHDQHVVSPPPAPLARTSSVLDRLRSFSLYLRPGDTAVPEDNLVVTKTPAAADEKTRQAAGQYARCRSEPSRDQGKKKLGAAQAKMSKTSSDVAEEAAASTEECVDARADDFINKFRQQLQLQRLNSLLSYGKQ